MPWYEYKCPKCGLVTEESRAIDKRNDLILCEKCNTEMKRTVNAPPVHFLGGNWAFDGYDELSAEATGGPGDEGYDDSVAKKMERVEREQNARNEL